MYVSPNILSQRYQESVSVMGRRSVDGLICLPACSQVIVTRRKRYALHSVSWNQRGVAVVSQAGQFHISISREFPAAEERPFHLAGPWLC